MSKIAILVVSFGTTYVETRRTTIEAIETAIQQAFPEATVFRAFTSKIVVRRIQENEHQHVDSPVEALKHIQEQGFDELWVQESQVFKLLNAKHWPGTVVELQLANVRVQRDNSISL